MVRRIHCGEENALCLGALLQIHPVHYGQYPDPSGWPAADGGKRLALGHHTVPARGADVRHDPREADRELHPLPGAGGDFEH